MHQAQPSPVRNAAGTNQVQGLVSPASNFDDAQQRMFNSQSSQASLHSIGGNFVNPQNLPTPVQYAPPQQPQQQPQYVNVYPILTQPIPAGQQLYNQQQQVQGFVDPHQQQVQYVQQQMQNAQQQQQGYPPQPYAQVMPPQQPYAQMMPLQPSPQDQQQQYAQQQKQPTPRRGSRENAAPAAVQQQPYSQDQQQYPQQQPYPNVIPPQPSPLDQQQYAQQQKQPTPRRGSRENAAPAAIQQQPYPQDQQQYPQQQPYPNVIPPQPSPQDQQQQYLQQQQQQYAQQQYLQQQQQHLLQQQQHLAPFQQSPRVPSPTPFQAPFQPESLAIALRPEIAFYVRNAGLSKFAEIYNSFEVAVKISPDNRISFQPAGSDPARLLRAREAMGKYIDAIKSEKCDCFESDHAAVVNAIKKPSEVFLYIPQVRLDCQLKALCKVTYVLNVIWQQFAIEIMEYDFDPVTGVGYLMVPTYIGWDRIKAMVDSFGPKLAFSKDNLAKCMETVNNEPMLWLVYHESAVDQKNAMLHEMKKNEKITRTVHVDNPSKWPWITAMYPSLKQRCHNASVDLRLIAASKENNFEPGLTAHGKEADVQAVISVLQDICAPIISEQTDFSCATTIIPQVFQRAMNIHCFLLNAVYPRVFGVCNVLYESNNSVRIRIRVAGDDFNKEVIHRAIEKLRDQARNLKKHAMQFEANKSASFFKKMLSNFQGEISNAVYAQEGFSSDPNNFVILEMYGSEEQIKAAQSIIENVYLRDRVIDFVVSPPDTADLLHSPGLSNILKELFGKSSAVVKIELPITVTDRPDIIGRLVGDAASVRQLKQKLEHDLLAWVGQNMLALPLDKYSAIVAGHLWSAGAARLDEARTRYGMSCSLFETKYKLGDIEIAVVKGGWDEVSTDCLVCPINVKLVDTKGLCGKVRKICDIDFEKRRAQDPTKIAHGNVIDAITIKQKPSKVYFAITPTILVQGYQEHTSQCVQKSMKLAAEHGMGSVAIPGIGGGNGGYLPIESARIIVSSLRLWYKQHSSVKKIVLFDVNDDIIHAFRSALQEAAESQNFLWRYEADKGTGSMRQFKWMDRHALDEAFNCSVPQISVFGKAIVDLNSMTVVGGGSRISKIPLPAIKTVYRVKSQVFGPAQQIDGIMKKMELEILSLMQKRDISLPFRVTDSSEVENVVASSGAIFDKASVSLAKPSIWMFSQKCFDLTWRMLEAFHESKTAAVLEHPKEWVQDKRECSLQELTRASEKFQEIFQLASKRIVGGNVVVERIEQIQNKGLYARYMACMNKTKGLAAASSKKLSMGPRFHTSGSYSLSQVYSSSTGFNGTYEGHPTATRMQRIFQGEAGGGSKKVILSYMFYLNGEIRPSWTPTPAPGSDAIVVLNPANADFEEVYLLGSCQSYPTYVITYRMQ